MRSETSTIITNNYSLVPKESHMRKEGNGSTLGLCVVPKDGSTLVKELTPKEIYDCSFSYTRSKRE